MSNLTNAERCTWEIIQENYDNIPKVINFRFVKFGSRIYFYSQSQKIKKDFQDMVHLDIQFREKLPDRTWFFREF